MPHHMAMRRRVNQKAMKLLTPFELQAEGGSLQPAAVNAAVSHAAVRAGGGRDGALDGLEFLIRVG